MLLWAHQPNGPGTKISRELLGKLLTEGASPLVAPVVLLGPASAVTSQRRMAPVTHSGRSIFPPSPDGVLSGQVGDLDGVREVRGSPGMVSPQPLVAQKPWQED